MSAPLLFFQASYHGAHCALDAKLCNYILGFTMDAFLGDSQVVSTSVYLPIKVIPPWIIVKDLVACNPVDTSICSTLAEKLPSLVALLLTFVPKKCWTRLLLIDSA